MWRSPQAWRAPGHQGDQAGGRGRERGSCAPLSWATSRREPLPRIRRFGEHSRGPQPRPPGRVGDPIPGRRLAMLSGSGEPEDGTLQLTLGHVHARPLRPAPGARLVPPRLVLG